MAAKPVTRWKQKHSVSYHRPTNQKLLSVFILDRHTVKKIASENHKRKSSKEIIDKIDKLLGM